LHRDSRRTGIAAKSRKLKPPLEQWRFLMTRV
jgi:hypothetical protein